MNPTLISRAEEFFTARRQEEVSTRLYVSVAPPSATAVVPPDCVTTTLAVSLSAMLAVTPREDHHT